MGGNLVNNFAAFKDEVELNFQELSRLCLLISWEHEDRNSTTRMAAYFKYSRHCYCFLVLFICLF